MRINEKKNLCIVLYLTENYKICTTTLNNTIMFKILNLIIYFVVVVLLLLITILLDMTFYLLRTFLHLTLTQIHTNLASVTNRV